MDETVTGLPRLAIVIPVFNEGANIVSALIGLREKVKSSFTICIVYDFDGDDTLPAVRSAEADLEMRIALVKNKYGRGVLNAIKTGLESASSEYVIVTMADLSDPPEVINAMVEKADAEKADIVCGSRYMKGGRQVGGPLLKGLMSRGAGLSLHYLARLATHDATNSFKLYRKSFLDKVSIESTGGFELGIELVVKAHRGGFKIAEVPSVWTDRVAGKSNFKLMKWLPSYLKWYFMAFTKVRFHG